MPADGLVRSSWPVGSHRVVAIQDVTADSDHELLVATRWTPPRPADLTHEEWHAYLSGLIDHMQHVADVSGQEITITTE